MMFTKLCHRFEVLLPPKKSAEENMRTDILLLHSLEKNPRVILHFYSWENSSATYGYFLNPSDYFNHNTVNKGYIDMARRPTGGGIIFHHCDLAYSVLIPSTHYGYSRNTLANYAFVNEAVSEAIAQFLGKGALLHLLQKEISCDSPHLSNFCMAKPTQYDVIFKNCKVGGAAQRRTKFGLLHQGTICLCLPTAEFLKKILISSKNVTEAMESFSWPLLGKEVDVKSFQKAKKEIQFFLIQSIQKKCFTKTSA